MTSDVGLFRIRLLAALIATLMGLAPLNAAATRSAVLPVPQGTTKLLTSGLFTSANGDVVVKYAASSNGKFVTHYFDLTRSHALLESQAAALGDDPRALGALENSQGLTRLAALPPAKAGGGTAASVDLAVGHCAWPYASIIRFSTPGGATIEQAAIRRRPAGLAPVAVAQACEGGAAGAQTVALNPRFQDLAPLLVADPSGGGYLAYFLDLPVVISFSPDGKADLPNAAGLRIVPGRIIAQSYAGAFGPGVRPQQTLAATDHSLAAYFANPAR